MLRPARLRLLLGGANVLLGAAILLFAARFLVVRPPSDPGAGLPVPVDAPASPGSAALPDRPLASLANPLSRAAAAGPEGALRLRLVGTLPNGARPDHAAAFLRGASAKEEFVAFAGESVGGWRLEEVFRDRVVLSDGRERREVRLEEPRGDSMMRGDPGIGSRQEDRGRAGEKRGAGEGGSRAEIR